MLTTILMALALQAPQVPALLPVPSTVSWRDGRMALDSTLSVAIVGQRDPRLERAVGRALRRLEARLVQPLPRTIGSDATARLVVRVGGAGYAVPDLREDESYTLDVAGGRATLAANTVVGAIRGLETLLQLHEVQGGTHWLREATIADQPRFPWRGLNVDVARHFHPPEVMRRIIDGMASVKLNVLHWHLTEDQGFRVESKAFPKLHQLGSDGEFYTQDEIRAIVAYAADRGIRVVPEFDMPGHTTAWFVGYPELASAPGPYAIERKWGVFKPTMDPTKESTWRFLDTFIAEMITLFPDRSWHVGGDEVDPAQWNGSPTIQQWMARRGLRDAHALQTAFNTRLFTRLAKHGRSPVGWDEILAPDLPREAVIQSWRGANYLVEAAKQGRQAILSAPWYLDHIKTSGEMYLEDPLPAGHGLTAAQQALVLGGEACMWAEYVTAETVESRIFPRIGAIAERLWSPASVRDVADMYRRLQVASRHMAEVGPTHEDHTARMIRRFAAGDDARLFTRLLDYARPRGFAGRGTNQLSPLTRVIDAARPDPWTEWQMVTLAEAVRDGDAEAGRNLMTHFGLMRSMVRELQGRHPLAGDVTPVAGALGELGAIGEELLGHRMNGTAPSAGRAAAIDSALTRLVGKTFGLLRPVGGEAVKRLR
jgi:hexosaminidase